MSQLKASDPRKLVAVVGDKVTLPSHEAYQSSMGPYWSAQAASVRPSCVVSPKSAEDVSILLKSLCNPGHNCKFAVRGGGHTPWAESANIEDGITIDMRAISGVSVSDDQSIAYVSAGPVWGDVYKKMDSLGLAVVGGRGSTIGVGGLLTGGGISYFSSRKGFACDNVVNYEVVLVDGTITNANSKKNSDLFLALKGDFWGGVILYHDSASPALIDAFAALNSATGFDEHAHILLSFSSVSGVGEFASTNIQYTMPAAEPEAFQPFIAVQPQLTNTTRISSQTDFVTEFVTHQDPGRRQMYITNTFKNDLTFLKEIYGVYKAAFNQFPQTKGVTLSLVVQPIQPAMTSRAREHGGNMLGLDPEDGPLVLCLFAISWDNPAEDDKIQQLARELNENVVKLAKERGLWNKWVYLNYASKFQDPITGYGEENKSHMQAVSKKYDPTGVFQKDVPGGFKPFI